MRLSRKLRGDFSFLLRLTIHAYHGMRNGKQIPEAGLLCFIYYLVSRFDFIWCLFRLKDKTRRKKNE